MHKNTPFLVLPETPKLLVLKLSHIGSKHSLQAPYKLFTVHQFYFLAARVVLYGEGNFGLIKSQFFLTFFNKNIKWHAHNKGWATGCRTPYLCRLIIILCHFLTLSFTVSSHMPTSGLTCDKFAIRFLELDWYGQPSSNVGHRSQELLQGRLGLVTNPDPWHGHARKIFKGLGTRLRNELRADLRAMYNGCFVLKDFQLEKSRGQGDFKMARFHVTSLRYTYLHNFGIRDVKMYIGTLNVHFCRRSGSPWRS